MIHQNFIYVAALINTLGGISYLVDTLKGRTIPNRITWLLWSTAPGIAFASQLSKGVGVTALFTFTTFFLPLLIFIASFINKQSVWRLGRLDYTCGGLSVVGILLWLITGEGNVAIVAGILADAFAAIPTLIKSYKDPKSENWIGYATGAIGALITVLTIKEFSFEASSFALYIFVMASTFVYLIAIRPKLVTVNI